ncbi:MAG TPA: transporter [Chitinophagaceae bacterium]|nr:transporter [Chitinophagaceae bacterium]
MKILIPLFLLIFSNVTAQLTPKIETDRPDQTESPYTVPYKWFQIESGLVKEQIIKNVSSYTIPTILWKYGLSEKTELRLITEYSLFYTRNKFADSTKLQPIQLGFKWNICEEKGLRPKASLIAHTGFNRLGSRFFRPLSFFAPNFRFTLQNSLTESISLGYNLGVEWEDTKSSAVGIYTFAPGFNLTDNWYAYVEIFGFVQKGESAQHNIDGGLAYNVTSNCKLDISTGFGISQDSPEWYVNLGGSFRFALQKKKVNKKLTE